MRCDIYETPTIEQVDGSRVANQRALGIGIPDPLTIDKSNPILVDDLGELMGESNDLLQGTLDLLILRTLAHEPRHGWAIAQRIQQISESALKVQQGSLYPALHRLEHQGWIKARWGPSENKRRAKFYSLTESGRRRLDSETTKWNRLSRAVDLVLAEG